MFQHKINSKKLEIDLIILYEHDLPQEELARYRVLVNQLEREKKESSSYPAAIRKPNSV